MSFPQMPQQPEPKKSSKWKKGCGGCAAIVVGFVVVAGIAGAVSGGHGSGKTAARPAASADSAPSATVTVTATPTHKAPAKPKAAPKPTSRTVLAMSGDGLKQTQTFTVTSDWAVHYSYNCSNFGQAGNFIVYEDYPNGDVLTSELAKSGSDTTYEHDGGKHSLEISSECSWSIRVVDEG